MPKTNFKPQIDGFAFNNSWTYDTTESAALHTILTDVVRIIAVAVAPLVAPFPDPVTLAIVGGALSSKIADWIQADQPGTYGLCGGMAWAALDYYKASWVVPRGASVSDQPKRPPNGSQAAATLRNYIWKRLIDSDVIGGAAASTLEWMGILKLVPNGNEILRQRSLLEWAKLKSHIDRGEPWPIGLIGTTSNPMHNHQVLAIGYDDPGDGTGILYLYDNNCPNKESVIRLDFRAGKKFAYENQVQAFYLFAYGNDQRLWSSKLMGGVQWMWEDHDHPPFQNVYQTPASVAYVDRATSTLKMATFVGDGSGSVWLNQFDGSRWTWRAIGHPGNISLSTPGLSAITYSDGDNQGIFVFARGNDGHLYLANSWDASTSGLFSPVFKQGAGGSGIGGYDLKSNADRGFAFDYDHSGKLDHLVFYRPGSGTCFILKNDNGKFSPVYPQGAGGAGIGGFDLRNIADRGFAFDYNHSGKLDHLVFYRPGSGACFILKNDNGKFSPVYQQGAGGTGIGGFDLKDAADQGFAFDYNKSGKLDHLVFYRPGAGACFILKNDNGKFSPVYQQGAGGTGIGGFDLKDTADRGFAFDYNHTGKSDHLVFYRPGTGACFIINAEFHFAFTTFNAKHSEGAGGNGIGGFDLNGSADKGFAFDYDSSGKLDHLVFYRPGAGACFVLANDSETYTQLYAQGAGGTGIGKYDLASSADLGFAFDYDHSGKADHLLFYRPGEGACFILQYDPSSGGHYTWADQGLPPNTKATSGIGVTTYRENGQQRIYAFVTCDNSRLAVNYWNGTQWQWADQGAPAGRKIFGKPASISYFDSRLGTTRIYTFLIGDDRHLYVNYWNGSQWQWADQGTPPSAGVAVSPSAITYPSEHGQVIEVFVIGNDGKLYQNRWDDSGWSWTDLGMPTSPATKIGFSCAPVAMTDVDASGKRSVSVFVRGADAKVWLNYWNGSDWSWIDLGLGSSQGLAGEMAVAALHVAGGCPSANRGELQGFFCENYVFSNPPVAVGISDGLRVTRGGPFHTGENVPLTFAARNYGYCPTPDLSLYIAGRPLANLAEVQDAGGESTMTPINVGMTRAIQTTAQIKGTIGMLRYSAVCHLGVFDGVDVWRLLPPVESGTSSFTDVKIE